jgi:uncharacterized protein (TIGR03067 family)
MRSAAFFLATASLFAAAEPRKDDARTDLSPLQGAWAMVLCFSNGDALPADLVKTGELVVQNNDYRAKLNTNAVASTIKVDPSKTPKEIDFAFTSGPQSGKTVKGIYKVLGDDLTICRGLTEHDDRPTGFAAAANSGLLLEVWKRSQTNGGDRASAIQEELKKFDATWRFVSIEFEGVKVPEEAFANDRLMLIGRTFTSVVGGRKINGVFRINPTVKPKTIDLTFTDGPGKGKTQPGIYELDGDTQIICFSQVGKPRPTEFTSKPGNGQMIQILKKEKP